MLENESPDDREYILRIYERFNRIMYSTARKYTSDLVAEDIVQDAMVKLIPKVSRLRGLERCTLAAYIVYTVRNTAKNYLRSQSVKSKHIVSTEPEDFDNYFDYTELLPEELILFSERKREFHDIWKNCPKMIKNCYGESTILN